MPGPSTPPWLARAEELRSEGATYAAIAAEVGATRNAVAHWLNRDAHNHQNRRWRRRYGYSGNARNGFTPSREKATTSAGAVADMATATQEQERWVTVGTRIPRDLAEELARRARESDRSVSAEIRRVLRERLDPNAKAGR